MYVQRLAMIIIIIRMKIIIKRGYYSACIQIYARPSIHTYIHTFVPLIGHSSVGVYNESMPINI